MNGNNNNYLNNSLLNNLNKSGIYPSPYNYVDYQKIELDEYVIHDSTLREGEQTPNIILSLNDKIRIAKKLNEIGIRRIEAGFPAASDKQYNTIKSLVKLDLEADIIAFARAIKEDIDIATETGVQGIIVSYSISSFHRENKFRGLTKEEYLNKLMDAISYAENKGVLVLYSAEDTSREKDLVFIKQAYKTAEQSGAKRARVIDTLGCMSPSGVSFLIKELKKTVKIPLEVHFHNDMGLSLANSLIALESGASTISTCVNGIGERAGITATEEAIAALYILYGINFFDINKLTNLSTLVEKLSRIKRPANKPITGKNVLIHSSGIHQDGILKNPVTYEFYPENLFGGSRNIEINELSGSKGIIWVARKRLGFDISEEQAKRIIQIIKTNFSSGKKTAYTKDELKKLIVKTIEE